MTPTEVTRLLALLCARSPHQRLEEGTAEAWAPDLATVPADVGVEAVRRLTARQTWVSLADLLTECERVRVERAGRRRLAELEERRRRELPHGEVIPVPAFGGPLRDLSRVWVGPLAKHRAAFEEGRRVARERHERLRAEYPRRGGTRAAG